MAGSPTAAEIAAAVAAAEIEKTATPLPKSESAQAAELAVPPVAPSSAPETPVAQVAPMAPPPIEKEIPAAPPVVPTPAAVGTPVSETVVPKTATEETPEERAVDVSKPAYKSPFGATPTTHPYTTSIYDDPAVAHIRTFKSDIADAVRTQNMSLARMAIKEDEQREEIAQEVKTSRRWSAFTIVAIVFFLAGGIGVLGYFYFETRAPSVVAPPQNAQITPLVAADEQGGIDTTALLSDTLRKKIRDELSSTKLRLGFIKDIYFVENTVRDDGTPGPARLLSADDLFAKLAIKNSDRLGRLLSNEFMFGIHSFNEQTAFLMLRFESYPGVAAELLSWEKTMRTDLLPILELPPSISTATSSAAALATTSLYTWDDEVIQNIDTRTLRDQSGSLVMLYSFLGSRDTALIATNEATFKEVLARYQNPRATH